MTEADYIALEFDIGRPWRDALDYGLWSAVLAFAVTFWLITFLAAS